MLDLPEIPRESLATTQQYAYARLRNAIMVGAIAPETVLTIRGIADCLGLSPTPIREALRRLNSERAVALLGNRRLSVPKMTAPRFDEIVRLRTALECHAARRALPYISDIVIDEMRNTNARMADHPRVEDHDPLVQMDHAFHQTLYTANPHQTVMPMIESLWLQLGPFQREVVRQGRTVHRVDRHEAILDALHHRDADALEAAIAADVQDGIGQAGLDALRQEEAEAAPA